LANIALLTNAVGTAPTPKSLQVILNFVLALAQQRKAGVG
jgi:hypothetical protein